VPSGPDHYRTLGVSKDALAGEIRAAHRALARRHHPDLVADPADRDRAERRMATIKPAVGCALRIGPVVLAVGLLFAILIVTALMTGDGNRPPAFQVGQCVHLHDDGMEVVPCITDSSVIVARGVAGTSCPMGAIAVVLPTRTEQVCVAPSVG